VNAWLVASEGADVRADAAGLLAASGVLVREIRREVPTLEEYFFRVTDPGDARRDKAATSVAAKEPA
ncbi:MAG: hypothetical protein AAF328_12075, partial [Planctomycetota bacterium]